jgi:caspase domain-containing protein
MRRRDLLAGAAAWAQLATLPTAFAQGGGPSTRAAVIIGVNKTGKLPILNAAVSGAKSVADWLSAEDFDVSLIADDNGPVTADAVKRAVTALVNRGTLHQLIVYFSGHGLAFAGSEFWLLTGAPDDVNEAVSLTECIDLAGRSGIPNVIFISDACRSLPSDFSASRLHGTVVFPMGSLVPGVQSPEVDRFYAASPGAASFEVSVAARNYTGIFTSTLLDAFKHPQDSMVRKVKGRDVVTNRSLKAFLLKEVPRRASAAGQITQFPDAKLESPDDNYIGRALAQVAAAPTTSQQPTFADVANHQLSLTGVGALASVRGLSAEVLEKAATDSGFRAAQQSILETKPPQSFEPETGLAINGAILRDVWVAGRVDPEIVSRGNGQSGGPALVQIPRGSRPVTVGLLFEDGSGTVLAALPGFIATVVVKDGSVISVAYAPSRTSPRWAEYSDVRHRVDDLRALVSTAAKHSVFRIEGNRDTRTAAAQRFADQIRVLKGIDPALGIYAAYAYADANLIEQAQSVRSLIRGDLGIDLFDVALMAGALSGRRIEGTMDVVPFCPMLTQGWQLLRVREVTLPEDAQKARDELRPALWTTIGPRGMEYIGRAIQSARRANFQ